MKATWRYRNKMADEIVNDPEVYYDAEHDTLRINFTGAPSVIADEVAWNVIVSYDAAGEPASIELDGASKILKDFIAQAAAAKPAKVKH